MAFNATLVPIDCFAVTASDSTLYAGFGLYVGVTGDVAVVSTKKGPSGAAVVFPSVPAGAILPIQFCKIKATGTTASGLVGFGPT